MAHGTVTYGAHHVPSYAFRRVLAGGFDGGVAVVVVASDDTGRTTANLGDRHA